MLRKSKIILVFSGLFILLSIFPVSAQQDFPGKDRIQDFYDYHEQQCVKKGWKKLVVTVDGVQRRLLWKAPEGAWKNGVIIVLHGGGGTYSNFCSNISIGEPMGEFAELALSEGFAVISLDSTDGKVTDKQGRSCGKRFDCVDQDFRDNIDLPFIATVLTKVVPALRPTGSKSSVFMVGISNGAFMTALAATRFPDKITAFAMISGGDPYGTYLDCDPDLTQRKNAPGGFFDSRTGKNIGEVDACVVQVYGDEPVAVQGPAFKQFHHEGDSGVNISCMRKVQKMLSSRGFKDEGPYIIKNLGQRKGWKHFWMREYNQPLIDFFKKFSSF